jgi:hypothetical protein
MLFLRKFSTPNCEECLGCNCNRVEWNEGTNQAKINEDEKRKFAYTDVGHSVVEFIRSLVVTITNKKSPLI